jgi:hypothetical protein
VNHFPLQFLTAVTFTISIEIDKVPNRPRPKVIKDPNVRYPVAIPIMDSAIRVQLRVFLLDLILVQNQSGNPNLVIDPPPLTGSRLKEDVLSSGIQF